MLKSRRAPDDFSVASKSMKGRMHNIKWLFSTNKSALVALVIVLFIMLTSLLSKHIVPYDPTVGALSERLLPPSISVPPKGGFPHILGTDQMGRDVLSRLLSGGRISLTIAVMVTIIGAMIGITLGLTAGYFGGRVDFYLMRFVDVMASFPGTIVVMTFIMVLGPGVRNLTIALFLVSWMTHARMARAETLKVRSSCMIESARAIGASTPRILFMHVLPNIIAPLVTVIVMELSYKIIAEANFSFLGFGVQPPQSSWGLMIGEGRQYISQAWWLVTFPGIIIAVTALCMHLIGNWIRQEFDPLSKKH